ncbi:MAG: sigma-70 family RNA polymerase sigma factor [Propionibacteriaceae bacterium]|nr:sigma-70 family RNA polymerase sigma factor [Propionibacteriaceae bacterium]
MESLYSSEWPDLVRLAVVVSGDFNGASEIVQDVFVDLVRDRAKIRNPRGWLRTAVVHRARSKARRRVSAENYLRRYGDVEAVGDFSGSVVEKDRVRIALANLGPEQRATVFFRYYLDLPDAEIAEALGCAVGTVKSRLSRAHAQLRQFLDEEGEFSDES